MCVLHVEYLEEWLGKKSARKFMYIKFYTHPSYIHILSTIIATAIWRYIAILEQVYIHYSGDKNSVVKSNPWDKQIIRSTHKNFLPYMHY